MPQRAMRIERPLVIMFEAPGGEVVCHIHPSKIATSHRHYGLAICDLVRHVSRAFKVAEDDVWEWVDKERDRSSHGRASFDAIDLLHRASYHTPLSYILTLKFA